MRWTVVMAVALAACGDRSAKIEALDGDATAGQAVYTTYCVSCHGTSGLGEEDPDHTNLIGMNLTEAAGETGNDAEFIDIILNGKEEMTPFGDILEDQQIADVLAYMHDGLFD